MNIIPGNYRVVHYARSEEEETFYISTDARYASSPNQPVTYIFAESKTPASRFTRSQKLATMRLFACAPELLRLAEEIVSEEERCYSAEFADWDTKYANCREAWPDNRARWCRYCQAAHIVEYVRSEEPKS